MSAISKRKALAFILVVTVYFGFRVALSSDPIAASINTILDIAELVIPIVFERLLNR